MKALIFHRKIYGHKAKCCRCGFEVEVLNKNSAQAAIIFEHRGWKIKDSNGVKEASGEPCGGDICGFCNPKIVK
jgi:hypothetical protein